MKNRGGINFFTLFTIAMEIILIKYLSIMEEEESWVIKQLVLI